MEEKEKRIVVMGGSFNPPTLAHYRLMKETLDALDAGLTSGRVRTFWVAP
ncbi:MAG: hypothetical protein IKH26_08595 [Bacteroidaceae bacterium]|nr:hypothetical protein [Bacteroidaceae bacterium]